MKFNFSRKPMFALPLLATLATPVFAGDASYAINAYVGPNVKLSLNYVDVLSVKGGLMNGNEPSAVMLRTQFSY